MLITARYDILECPDFQNLKKIQFSVIEEERNQKMFTFNKLESENHFFLR